MRPAGRGGKSAPPGKAARASRAGSRPGRAAGGSKPRRGPTGGGWWVALAATCVAAAGVGAGVWYASVPRGAHGWRPLGRGLGSIRWVETSTSPTISPPAAPEWVARLRRWRVPWPGDLPAGPSAAAFGAAGDTAAAWFLVRSARPVNELWHVEKSSVSLTDPEGRPVPWPGGSGAVRASRERQFVYLRVPLGSVARPGATLRFRLARNRETSPVVAFRLE